MGQRWHCLPEASRCWACAWLRLQPWGPSGLRASVWSLAPSSRPRLTSMGGPHSPAGEDTCARPPPSPGNRVECRRLHPGQQCPSVSAGPHRGLAACLWPDCTTIPLSQVPFPGPKAPDPLQPGVLGVLGSCALQSPLGPLSFPFWASVLLSGSWPETPWEGNSTGKAPGRAG